MNLITIDIYTIINSNYCAEPEDGDIIYSYIKEALQNKKNVIISFKNIDLITSCFFKQCTWPAI